MASVDAHLLRGGVDWTDQYTSDRIGVRWTGGSLQQVTADNVARGH